MLGVVIVFWKMNLGREYFAGLEATYDGDFSVPEVISQREGSQFQTKLGLAELGTNANPFAHAREALAARIREGFRKIEWTFMGTGKGSSQQPTPESYDKRDREELRQLAKLNQVKTSVHAAPGVMGLAGFSGEGFDPLRRNMGVVEVKKAIDFAADASTGGAVVVHTGEWQRPIYEHYGKEGFEMFEDEASRAPMMVVDKQTGRITGFRKNDTVHEPKFLTAGDLRKAGKKVDEFRDKERKHRVRDEDWVDLNGHYIDPMDARRLFDRVPAWKPDETQFETVERSWEDVCKEVEAYNREHGTNISPAVWFARKQLINQISQAKGNSLYHAQRYESYAKAREQVQKALDFYRKLEGSLPEEKKKQLLKQVSEYGIDPRFVPAETERIVEYLERKKKEYEDQMRHTHQASASADVQAAELLKRMNDFVDLETFGLQETAKSLSDLGIMAWRKTQERRHELDEPIYIAPENYDPATYGSHPDELIKIVEASRKAMAERLVKEGRMSEEQARKVAKQHIKSTLDIGHMNMWRQHLKRKEGESPEAFDKRFKQWYVGKIKKLADAGVLGHIHLTDNFGYHDEHLTPGMGNTPVKEAMKILEEAGVKDFIVEPGSFNPTTALPDTLSYFGAGIGTAPPRMFNQFHERHFGYNSPSNYIVGAYAPSNEWRLWSEVPLE
ncbi:hypothetical protein D6783_06020 [Candidatus Woesearchaeota archaeon]|nr:MAG: hypothetical protein D6783_06020 [Candidatus Woesearchaeota archaeon]